MKRRVSALEGEGDHMTIGDLLDGLDGPSLTDLTRIDPDVIAGLQALQCR